MGLDISHDAWHGAYSAFMRWREKIAEVAGFPPLELMEGFYDENGYNSPWSLLDSAYPKGDELAMSCVRRIREKLPIKWDKFLSDPLCELLFHSDCDGELSYGKAGKIAARLKELLPLLPDEDAGGHIGKWKEKTEAFIKGCELAYSKKEKLIFH